MKSEGKGVNEKAVDKQGKCCTCHKSYYRPLEVLGSSKALKN